MKPLFSILVGLCVVTLSTQAQAAPTRRGSGSKAYLGVALARLTPLDRRQKKVPRYGGVLIQTVLRRTPAAKAGFRPGDVIMRLNGKYVYKPKDVISRVSRARVGTRLKIDIIRNGSWMMARVLLTARPRTAPTHVEPRHQPTPPRVKPGRGAILRHLMALRREVRQLKKMIRGLKRQCKRP
jgi:serine protease Do